MWDGHGNFELCATVKSCKYMCKYVLKGHNKIEMGVKERRHKIKDYSNGCYVSSMEAAYHILGFPMHGELHSIIRLEVENSNWITFNPSQSRTKTQGQMCKKSKSEAFLKLNIVDSHS